MNKIIEANLENDNKTWMVDISGKHIEKIKDYLINEGIEENGVGNIVNNAAKTLGYCPNPLVDEEKSITGLVIGKVQSGKTSNFISLIALAFDNNYNIVIVFGGTKNNLLKQNKTRIEEYFENVDDVVVLSTVEDKDELTESKINNFIELGKKIIIVTLKHPKRINDLREDLISKSSINEQPILIIDDEGDEYSLNTLSKKGKESAVFSAIKQLLAVCKKRAFISVTATPQANIIIPVVNVLSPDFGLLVEPGVGYCGLDTFHDVGSQYCIEIDESEKSILDNNGVPESFYKALSMYFVGAAIYHERSEKNKKYSILIHPSRIVKDLSSVLNKTEEIVEHWRMLARNPDDIEFESLKNHLKVAFEEYRNQGVAVKNYDEIQDAILYQIKDCGIHLITGNNHLNDKDKNYTNNIYIGGDMLGRGLTIKGLSITYIIRTSKGTSNVDTVQQRARWFGYKRDILDLCRIFASKKILEEFEDIKNHEEDLWFTIEQNNLNGINFKNMKRLFILSDRLRMTRTSVAETTKYSFNSWNCENNFIERQEFQNNNVAVINQILRDFSDKIQIESYGKDSHNKVIRDLSFSTIVNDYLSKFHFPLEAECNYTFIKKINEFLANTGEEIKCDLVWPRCEKIGKEWVQKDSKHDVKNGKIKNYMVGQRPKGAIGDDIKYPGDRRIIRGNVIEIQFHNIYDNLTGRNSVTIALYIPSNYIGRMQNLIVAEN